MPQLPLLGGGLIIALGAVALPAQDDAAPRSSVAALTRSPGFIANHGQWPDPVRFRNKAGGATAWVRDDGLTLRLEERSGDHDARGVVLSWTFVGATPARRAQGEDRLPGEHNFFIGRDRRRWATGVPSFARTVAADAYPGIDVVWQWRDGKLAYDLHVAPGADPSQVVTRIDGASSLQVNEDGDMVVATGTGEVTLTAPVSWERDGACRRPVDSRFVLDGPSSYHIAVQRVDTDAHLVIDPGLEWSSRYGSSNDEICGSIAADAQNRVYSTGWTNSTAFPTTIGAYQTTATANFDAVVTCLDWTQAGVEQLQFSTYLGGDNVDHGFDIAVNPAGTEVTFVGAARSSDLPTVNAFQPGTAGLWEAFVAQLTDNGRTLRWSTYAGGAGNDWAQAIERVNPTTIVVAGACGNQTFPTTPGAFQRNIRGGSDAFIMVLRPGAAPGVQLVASTRYGGGSTEQVTLGTPRTDWDTMDVALDPAGGYVLAGTTQSANLPRSGNVAPGMAAQQTFGGGNFDDCFIALFSADLTTLRYGTFLGGDNSERFGEIEMDSAGVIYAAGTTFSTDFPLSSNPISSQNRGSGDGFIVKVDPQGQGSSDLLYSTFLGDVGTERLEGMSLEASGIVVACGRSDSGLVTTPGGFQINSSGDAVIVRVDPANNGAQDLHYVSYLGDSADVAAGIAPSSDGAYFIAGTTQSGEFPTTPGAYTSIATGMGEMFAARIDTLPTNMTRFPVTRGGTAPCTGSIDLQVSRRVGPGARPFELIANDTPPLSSLALVLLGVPLNGSFLFLTPRMLMGQSPLETEGGALMYVLPNLWQFSRMPGTLGAPIFEPKNGFMRVQIPDPPMVPGGQVNLSFQCVFVGTATCGGATNLFASDRISF